jgi:hypothetical protein
METAALRKLRNLGLIGHDRPHLFTPVRSTKVWPTPCGRFIVALYRRQSPGTDSEGLARETIQNLTEIEHDHAAMDLLRKVQQSERVSVSEQEVARKLRNLNLITHTTELLAETTDVALTGAIVKCCGLSEIRRRPSSASSAAAQSALRLRT